MLPPFFIAKFYFKGDVLKNSFIHYENVQQAAVCRGSYIMLCKNLLHQSQKGLK